MPRKFKVFKRYGEWFCDYPGPNGHRGEMNLHVADEGAAVRATQRIFRTLTREIETEALLELRRRECAERIATLTGDK